VNAGNSTGSSGLSTNLAPSMTLGTGFIGRSSIGENLEPRHLVNWTRVAYNSAPAVPFGNFTGVEIWDRPAGPVPAYPRASNLSEPGALRSGAAASGPAARGPAPAADGTVAAGDAGLATAGVREQLRAIIIEELRQLIG
jgi:acetaldehyde dehydrogenase/alcohol dehydrogenase